MLTLQEQKDIMIEEINIKKRIAVNLAKFCRRLKLFNRAASYYHLSKGYKDSIEIIKNSR